MTTMDTRVVEETIYVAPGNSQCRVYVMPYPLRPGQRPEDLAPQYQDQWLEIGLLNFQLRLVYISPKYAHLREDIEGLMGGTTLALRNGQVVN